LIVAFSTSSPWASVAAIDGGEVLWSKQVESRQQAGGACHAMIEEMTAALGFDLSEAEAFAADIGPGSFTGVRVGVMLAKTFAFVYGRAVMGADSFDLIDPDGVVVLPSKRGEFFARAPGQIATRTAELPKERYRGFGPGVEPSEPPSAAGFAPLVHRLERVDPIAFAPHYLIDPSISTPKKPYAAVRGGAAA